MKVRRPMLQVNAIAFELEMFLHFSIDTFSSVLVRSSPGRRTRCAKEMACG